MKCPCEVQDTLRFVGAAAWDWASGRTPPMEQLLVWPRGAEPPPSLVARVEQLAAWTREFAGQFRGISLHTLTIVDDDEPPGIAVLLVRDDIDDAYDEDAAASAAGRALAQQQPGLAAGVSFRGEYIK